MAANAKNKHNHRMNGEELFRALSDLKEEVKARYRIDQAVEDLTPARLRKTGPDIGGAVPLPC